MPVPNGEITSTDIYKQTKEEEASSLISHPEHPQLIREIVQLMMFPGGYGENAAAKIVGLVLADVELSKKVLDEWVPLPDPDWDAINDL